MKKKKPARPRWKRIVGAAGYTLILATVLVASSLYGWMRTSRLGSALVGQVLHTPASRDVFAGRRSINLLLLGCDVDLSTGGKRVLNQQARADMMLVTRLDFAQNQITGVSIPRDTQVSVPGYRTRKINAYHAIAPKGEGGELTKRAVEKLLPGVRIDRVVVLNYEAFERMVDLVGGVELRVDKRMKYDDNAGGLHIDFQPGPQRMDGHSAMGFVRFRHDDSDFRRQERQKQFLVAFKQSLMRNPTVLPSVLDEAMNVVDNALTPEEVAHIAFFAKGVPSNRIRLGQIPVRPGRGTNLVVDERKLSETLATYDMTSPARVSLR